MNIVTQSLLFMVTILLVLLGILFAPLYGLWLIGGRIADKQGRRC